MESRLRSERFPPQAGLEPGTTTSVSQHLTHGATRALRKRSTVFFSFGGPRTVAMRKVTKIQPLQSNTPLSVAVPIIQNISSGHLLYFNP